MEVCSWGEKDDGKVKEATWTMKSKYPLWMKAGALTLGSRGITSTGSQEASL